MLTNKRCVQGAGVRAGCGEQAAGGRTEEPAQEREESQGAHLHSGRGQEEPREDAGASFSLLFPSGNATIIVINIINDYFIIVIIIDIIIIIMISY
jgi:hypothetical protein